MKTIKLTDIKVKEVRIEFFDGEYRASILYSQIADDGTEFDTRTTSIEGAELTTLLKGRLGKVIESAVDITRLKEGI